MPIDFFILSSLDVESLAFEGPGTRYIEAIFIENCSLASQALLLSTMSRCHLISADFSPKAPYSVLVGFVKFTRFQLGSTPNTETIY